jgi:hypothetical protein
MIGEMLSQLKNIRLLKKLWIGLFLLKFVMAGLIILPFTLVANSDLSLSAFSRSLVSDWDLSVILELFAQSPDFIPMLLGGVFAGAIIYLVIMQFLNGGIYFLMVSGRFENIDWREFFAECGGGFRHNIYITFLMFPIYLIFLISANVFVNMISFAANDLVGKTALVMMLIKLIIIFLVLLVVSIFADSARSAAAAYPDKNFREILKTAADYFRPRFRNITLIYILTFIPFLIVWGLVEKGALLATGHFAGFIGVALEFLLFQISSFVRTGQKLWFLACLGKDFRLLYQGRFLPKQAELRLE